MSYDVIITETVGEVSKEYKFKDYRDFLDWELQGEGVKIDCTGLLTKKEELIRLTKENVRELVKEGDTVFIKSYSESYADYGDISLNYTVIGVEDLSYDGDLLLDLGRSNNWIDFSDDKLEIYKVIKN